jgi:hypothetical protein
MFIMFKDKHHHAILIVLMMYPINDPVELPDHSSHLPPRPATWHRRATSKNSARPGTKIGMVPSKNSDVTIKVEQLVPHLYFLGHRKRGEHSPQPSLGRVFSGIGSTVIGTM